MVKVDVLREIDERIKGLEETRAFYERHERTFNDPIRRRANLTGRIAELVRLRRVVEDLGED